jgi:serine phosphatase RsbU (regulator of sigma subunit)
LVQHSESVPANATIQDVQRRFSKHCHDFMAVLDGERVLGICSREQVGTLLGAQFGFALYARQSVRDQLVPSPMIIPENQPIESVLQEVFSRKEEDFYQDVALVDVEGKFVGLILVVSLVRLQTRFLTDTIERVEWHEHQLRAQNTLMLDELRLAREVQFALVPRNSARASSGSDGRSMLEWSFRYMPAGMVSGDFVYVQPIGTKSAAVLICDVMGHGVRAALITAMIRAFVQQLQPFVTEPHHLLRRLNGELMRMLANVDDAIFATACYVVADLEGECWRWANAGHPAPLLLQRPTGTVHPLGNLLDAGPALGLLPEPEFDCSEFPLKAGDRFVLYTDGITEARNSMGEDFGPERLAVAIRAHSGATAEHMLDGLLKSAQEFTGRAEAKDDVCVFVIDVTSA